MSRNFKDFVQASSDAVGKSSNVPAPFRQWSALSAVAGALGRSCWYDTGAFKIRSNLFIALIAGPGRNKSVSLLLPFRGVFSNLTTPTGSKEGDEKFNTKLKAYGLEKEPLHLISDRITPEKLAVEMSKIGRLDLKLGNPTDGLFHDSSLTLVTSEFGTFMSRNDHYLQMFMTEMWDALDQHSYLTKTAGEYTIKGPCLNWIACATPEQFVENLPENAMSQGLLSRLIIVYYDGPKVEEDIYYGKPSSDMVEALREDLAHISKLKGQFKIDPDFVEGARADVKSGLQPRPSDANLSEYLQRRLSHLFKVAMSVSAARRDDLIIGEEEWNDAKSLLVAAEEHMPKALQLFGVGKAGQVAFNLEQFVQEVWKTSRKGMATSAFRKEIMKRVATAGEVEQTFKAMVDAGMVLHIGDVIYPKGSNGKHTEEEA